MSDPRAPPFNPQARSRPGPRPVSQIGSPGGSTRGASVSSSATAVPSSLLTMLTKPTTEGYPATEIIKYLIEVVGRDVVSFRRNSQVSFLLVDRAREICDAINSHIKKTESGTDWASFEKFSNAVDPVEDALFKLVAFTEDEKALHLVEGSSVQDCIASADNWVTNREEIWTALGLLETKTEFTNLFSGVNVSSRQAEREEARNYDDKTFFGEVIEEIDRAFSSLPRVPQVVRKMIDSLHELFNKVSKSAIPPDITKFTLKVGLLVQGVTRLAFQTPSLDSKTKGHLLSAPVWGAAGQLVDVLNSTRDDGTQSMNNVRAKYDEFLNLLLNIPKGIEVPKSYIELLKLAGRVRRPFYSQAVELISLCRMLVTEFEKDTYRTQENLVPLEEALNATIKALEEASAAVKELKIFNLDNFEDHPAYKALTRAQTHIKTCYSTFGLGDWSKKELLIGDAERKDKERMDWINRLLETRPSLTSQGGAEQIELTVVVYDRSTSGSVHQTTFPVEGSTRLSAVRWTVAGALAESLIKRARQSGEFLLLPDDTECKLHDPVSQHAGSRKKCALRLIV
ncbi:hypothetical protein BJY52DRAFT_253062 [Lactarius psammicola]|nr:hypothetical protein BJY52DRAFT_253062 [Lactarius psammicola]